MSLFPLDAFAGTAAGYLAGRPPYPEALWRDLLARAPAPSGGRLLDLACGPGRIAFALADRFADIWAVDLEPEMIEAGQAEAARRGVAHIRWQVGAAEALEAPGAHFSHIAIGEAFQRLDQPLIAGRALRWLAPGGVLAILGHDGPFSGQRAWQRTVNDLVAHWRARVSAVPPPPVSAAPSVLEPLFRATGFVEVSSFEFFATRTWSPEAILAYLRTTSYASRHVLGGEAEAFEAELGAALRALDPGGACIEDERFGYTFARRP